MVTKIQSLQMQETLYKVAASWQTQCNSKTFGHYAVICCHTLLSIPMHVLFTLRAFQSNSQDLYTAGNEPTNSALYLHPP